jgi:hypothetical protein
MNEHGKTRNAASEVLITMRSRMGKSQASFAVEVMKTAVTTVARWETHGPPSGDLLLRLRDIATEHHFHDLADRFELLYREETQKPLRSNITRVLATEDSPEHGHLTATLPSKLALEAAQALVLLLAQLDSPDPKIKQNALSTLSSLRAGVRRFENPAVGQMQDAFRTGAKEQNPSAEEPRHDKKRKK